MKTINKFEEADSINDLDTNSLHFIRTLSKIAEVLRDERDTAAAGGEEDELSAVGDDDDEQTAGGTTPGVAAIDIKQGLRSASP